METQKKEIVIPHVQGNVLTLAIPLQREIVSLVNGQVDISYEDFVPTGPVTVVLTCGNYAAKYKATMDDELTNVAHIEDNGTLPVGVYSITIRCRDENTKPMRYKKRAVVNVVDTTAEAGIVPGAEFETGTQWLDAAVFLAFGGGGGTGEETDPIFSASPAAGITAEDIDRWNAGGSGGSGYQVTYADGVLTFVGSHLPTYNNGILTL